jgi:hypothetical protein
VVHSECLQQAIRRLLVPHKSFAILLLVVVVDGVESGRAALSKRLLVTIEGSLVPLKCLAILPVLG